MKRTSIKHTTLLTLCMIASMTATSQTFNLWQISNRDVVSLDLDRVFNYNLYEHTRWGVGLDYKHTGRPQRNELKSLFVGQIYGAYGMRDERWKAGLAAKYTTAQRKPWTLHAYAFFDLTPAASRQLDAYHIMEFGNAAQFMSRRFAETGATALGLSRMATTQLWLYAEMRWTYETPLYDAHTTYYFKQGIRHRDLGRGRYLEAIGRMRHNGGLQAELTVGHAFDASLPYARLLVQYNRTLRGQWLEYSLYAQGGIATPHAPYSRLFDLGGGLGSYIAFEHSLLTTRYADFGGHLFGLGTARVGFYKPLVNWVGAANIGLRPRPYVQASAAWSALYDADADGLASVERGETLPSGIALPDMQWRSLNHGLVELQAGINGLLHWGVADYGVALVWRWVPPTASYRNTNRIDDFQLFFTASLAL